MILLIPFILLAAFSATGQGTSKTVWSGVYTAEQAARGEAQFQTHCAECHDGDLDTRSTASRLIGDRFMDRWREESLGYLFNFVSTSMPRRAPASLTEGVYIDIVSFLMRSNHFPDGTAALSKGAVEAIRFERKDGPKPLPGNALVQLVGCLSVDPDEVWFLTNATEPVRTRKSMEIGPEELKSSETTALGSHTFRLTNFEFVGSSFRRLNHIGHKLLVKGTLIRQTNRDRISLTALTVLSEACEPH